MSDGRLRRRLVSVPGVFTAALLLTVLLPVWVAIAIVVDLVRLRWRFPVARLLSFGLAWAWLEVAGVTIAVGLWLGGRAHDLPLNYRLQRWWAAQILGALRLTCGLEVAVEGQEALHPGPVVLFARHASLADSVVSATVVAVRARLRPRFVLKRELLADPCLDIVGNRIPNHFVDRGATDSAPELAALTRLSEGMGPDEVAVIFPEGTRANPAKRTSSLARLAERDPVRAQRLAGLRHLLPPRPSGAQAMAAGAPGADIVVAWHTGLEGLDSFGGIVRALGRGPIVIRYVLRRVSRHDVGPDFVAWLDHEWLTMDAEVDAALAAGGTTKGVRHG